MADVQQAYATSEPPPTTSDYLSILEGELSEFERFSGDEKAQWLIDVAHGLCDPLERRGELWIWDDSDHHRSVGGPDSLEAKVYEYHVDFTVSITKISPRNRKAMRIITGSPTKAETEGDGRCWVTGMPNIVNVMNHHVCPKRMGDEQGTFIYNRYVGSPIPAHLSPFDTCFRISLCITFSAFFDVYEIGFRQFINNNASLLQIFPLLLRARSNIMSMTSQLTIWTRLDTMLSLRCYPVYTAFRPLHQITPLCLQDSCSGIISNV